MFLRETAVACGPIEAVAAAKRHDLQGVEEGAKKLKKALVILLLFAPAAGAADEIRAFCPGVTTAYAVVREPDGDVWCVAGQTFEAWGTGGRTAADYDLALTDKSGDLFVGDFDTNISDGSYHVAVHYQTGGAPADADPVIWVEYGAWDGSTFTGPASITDVAVAVREEMDANSTDLDIIIADTNELQTDWTDGGRLDLLIDGIKAMTDLISINTTTVATVDANDPNEYFTLTAGRDANDAYWMNLIMVEDATDGHAEVRWIEMYDVGRIVDVEEPFSFDLAPGDKAWVIGPAYGGLLQTIWSRLGIASSPVYYFDATSSGGASEGAGGASYYDQSGADP